MKTDKELLDWLEEYLLDGCLHTCFEFDGGVNAMFTRSGYEPLEFREKKSLRDILQLVSQPGAWEGR